MTYGISVRRQTELQSNQWGVYGVTIDDDGNRTEELLEGGFFFRANADAIASSYIADLVEAAERKAGWDPHP